MRSRCVQTIRHRGVSREDRKLDPSETCLFAPLTFTLTFFAISLEACVARRLQRGLGGILETRRFLLRNEKNRCAATRDRNGVSDRLLS
jgi:hypothetical protein